MIRRLKRYWKLALAMLVLGFALGQAGCLGSLDLHYEPKPDGNASTTQPAE